MKKFAIFSVIFILILLSCVLFGCGDANDIPHGTPTSWQNYCETLANSVSEQALTDDGLNFKAQVKYVSQGKEYLFALDFAYDPKNVDDAAAVINVQSDGKNVMSIKADNANSYIDIVQNSVLSGTKIKIEETNFFDWLNVEYNQNTQKETKEAIKRYVLDLCETFFKNGDKSADGKYLTFVLADDATGKTLAKFADILSFVDKNVLDLFLGTLGIEDANEILDKVGSISGSIKFTLENGKVVGAKGENFAVNGVASGIEVNFESANEDEIKATFPKSDTGYKVTKMATSSIGGTLASMDSTTKRIAVKYDMQLNANIDVMKLLYNGYDLNCLSDDNFLHLRLSHKCDSTCSSYCNSRIAQSKGAAIDIAFSPSAFGSHNLYINTNIKFLMSKEYLDAIGKYDNTVTVNTMPDYCMFTLVPEELGGEVCKILLQWYSSIMANEGGKIDFDFSEVKAVFDSNVIAKRILDDANSDEFDIDTLRMKVDDNIYGQVNEYDIYKEVVYIIDNEESALKSYTGSFVSGCKEYNALGWTYELSNEAKNTDGTTYLLSNIYDEQGNLIHGSNDSKGYVPMSATEAKKLVGKSVKYSYVNLEKNTVGNMYGEIVSLGDIYFSSTDLQEVKARVKRPSVLDYAWGIGDVRSNVMRRFFKCQGDECTQEVTLKIKLEEEVPSSFNLVSADKDEEYRVSQSSQIPKFIIANATIKYQNGYEKTINTIGKSDAVTSSIGLFSTNYHVINWGQVAVKFEVGGRVITKHFNVKKPDAFEFSASKYSVAIGAPCYVTSHVSLRAIYIDVVDGVEKKTSVSMRLSMSDFYIDETSLADDSTAWGHHAGYDDSVLVFYKSNEYTLRVKKNGFVSEPFNITVTPKQYTEPSYRFDAKGDVQSIAYVDADYLLNGSISNAMHGDGEDKEHTFKITVYEGKMQNGSLSFTQKASEDDYNVEWSVGTTAAQGDTLTYVLPTMIKNPITLNAQFVFSKAGYYRISLSIDGDSVYQLTLTVI